MASVNTSNNGFELPLGADDTSQNAVDCDSSVRLA
eukprot:CAMPEP_0205919828 /NCGR_PEP_ID=MMETSP1325-20131115/10690_1 /ASSEMBLY_ACC=CAM_ASM_000708 /TAXON_ID=236786 /ORGANISM="Florenciella sp., Strain RCC1007" /LENGTH=34 /DNA_ID= /DNA_START= /DNA_END= /DNA_ORIENTATION=